MSANLPEGLPPICYFSRAERVARAGEGFWPRACTCPLRETRSGRDSRRGRARREFGEVPRRPADRGLQSRPVTHRRRAAAVRHGRRAGDDRRRARPCPRTTSGEAAATTKAPAAQARTWTSTAGTTVEATVVELDGDVVVLEKTDGERLRVPLEKLSANDRQWVKNAGK
ncbi:MAG: SHD1 domain-containing protein [Planctomycetaceae bacterium]